ncbi:hypothetical protein [Nocardioides massiliensis]|uniref:Uncharacterized protein n=1 Tax=Nocardioides massiliensis TaxID=1325935 RepID=A0ABT9NLG8_9ACTN|nr:hypothetical protein [Nocardioides massiliensis]MDP9821054.1 hypothetical protein [Nocardioides massiliensis]
MTDARLDHSLTNTYDARRRAATDPHEELLAAYESLLHLRAAQIRESARAYEAELHAHYELDPTMAEAFKRREADHRDVARKLEGLANDALDSYLRLRAVVDGNNADDALPTPSV